MADMTDRDVVSRNTGVRPNAIAPLAEILRLNGYGTAAFGKYHEAPAWEISRVGPFDRWPTHSGFDKFYGFLGGEWAVGKASIGASGMGAAPLSPNTKISSLTAAPIGSKRRTTYCCRCPSENIPNPNRRIYRISPAPR